MDDDVAEADEAQGEVGGAGRPPAPSVTPGSAPPPPTGAVPRTWSRRGCATSVVVVGAVGLALLVAGVVALLVARGWLGDKVDDLAERRQEIVDETGIETGSTDVVHPPQRDVTIGACEGDGAGGVRASGTLTNWTGEPADYRISLSFRDRAGDVVGDEFGSTVVLIEDVAPETTTSWSGEVPVSASGGFTCRIVRIDRWEHGQEPTVGD